jgi:hypothetical protein
MYFKESSYEDGWWIEPAENHVHGIKLSVTQTGIESNEWITMNNDLWSGRKQ